MDAGVIVVIVVAALIVLALLVWLGRRGRERRLDTRRHEAREIRREAEVGRAQADQTRAEAEERAARARREEATAREQAALAEERQREARDRHLEAARVDPDVDEREAAERYPEGDSRDREGSRDSGETAVGGVTAHGYGEDNGAEKPGLKDRLMGRTGDDAVEHHEETRTPDEDRERHLVRDEEGNVVRDEESRHPRA
jgi:hypothetical protein